MTNYLKYIKLVSAFAIVGMLFFGGCTSTNNVTHEAAGIVITSVSPAVVSQTSTETSEAEIIKTGKFSSLTVNFQNLNGIPVTLKNYKVEYVDSYTGESLSSLSFGTDTTYTVGGAVSSSTTSSTSSSTTSSSTSGTSSTSTLSPTGNLTVSVVNGAVKSAIYRNVTDPTDNRILTAKITLYGNDFNGNGLTLETSVTIVP